MSKLAKPSLTRAGASPGPATSRRRATVEFNLLLSANAADNFVKVVRPKPDEIRFGPDNSLNGQPRSWMPVSVNGRIALETHGAPAISRLLAETEAARR